MRIAIALLVLVLVVHGEILRLGSNRSIQGTVVKETADKVFVDVGYTILDVPKKEIASREPDQKSTDPEEATASREIRDGLFRTIERGEASVRENVARTEAAVVMVRTPNAIGSGFFISPDGYLITNDHVIQGETSIWIIRFKRGKDGAIDKEKLSNVRIVATNRYSDLALLKVEGVTDLPHVYLGNSRELKSGQPVYAIGNPHGLDRTVSEGILSTLNRAIEGLPHLQTTAAVNPGNSGGPLFDMQGRVIGVVNLKMGDSEGLNFAIPSERLIGFLRDRDAFAYDKDHPNSGYRYMLPPPKSLAKQMVKEPEEGKE